MLQWMVVGVNGLSGVTAMPSVVLKPSVRGHVVVPILSQHTVVSNVSLYTHKSTIPAAHGWCVKTVLGRQILVGYSFTFMIIISNFVCGPWVVEWLICMTAMT